MVTALDFVALEREREGEGERTVNLDENNSSVIQLNLFIYSTIFLIFFRDAFLKPELIYININVFLFSYCNRYTNIYYIVRTKNYLHELHIYDLV